MAHNSPGEKVSCDADHRRRPRPSSRRPLGRIRGGRRQHRWSRNSPITVLPSAPSLAFPGAHASPGRARPAPARCLENSTASAPPAHPPPVAPQFPSLSRSGTPTPRGPPEVVVNLSLLKNSAHRREPPRWGQPRGFRLPLPPSSPAGLPRKFPRASADRTRTLKCPFMSWFSVRVPASSANLGAGFDALGPRPGDLSHLPVPPERLPEHPG